MVVERLRTQERDGYLMDRGLEEKGLSAGGRGAWRDLPLLKVDVVSETGEVAWQSQLCQVRR